MIKPDADNQRPAAPSCTLYCFPDIDGRPCRALNRTAPESAAFVSDVHPSGGDRSPAQVDRTDDAPGGETIEAAFDKGLAQGRADAMATYRKRVDRAVAALEAALREMGAMRKKEVACLEAETLRLAMAIAKKIVGWETAHGPVILHAIRKAMEKVTEPQPVTLKVNPADIDTVNRLNVDQGLSGRCDHRISIAADDRVAPGGCIIETPFGDVDARIDRQIAVVEAVLSARLPDPAEKG